MTEPDAIKPCPVTQWRKKPVVIDAVQINTPDDARGITGVCTGGPSCKSKGAPDDAWPHVHTLEGDHTWSPGDWLIRGVKGEYYFCKPDIFAATYEPASSPPLEQPAGERSSDATCSKCGNPNRMMCDCSLPGLGLATPAPTEAAMREAERRGVAKCLEIIRQQRDDFLSPEYATGQPMSSFQERFACTQCADEIEREFGIGTIEQCELLGKPTPIEEYRAAERNDG